MYFRAGVISLGLLLLSRVLGLARESVQAAAFGTTAMGDLAVLMLTLPDLATAILASGALAYALLPWWARQSPLALARSQQQAAWTLVAVGGAMALALWLAPQAIGRWLAPGLGTALQPHLVQTLYWAAPAIPAALLASLWYTRLQHERDVVGMYGMNIVHTGVIILAMIAVAWRHPGNAIHWLGTGLLLAMGLRLVFLRWRLRGVDRRSPPDAAPSPVPGAEPTGTAPVQIARPADGVLPRTDAPLGLPGWTVWFWAILASGVPAAVPLLARSLVSSTGEGELAAFNYAWKLVELPNLLAIQLVATLAFPALTRAYADGRDFLVPLRAAFMLSWTLAWAGALALWVGAWPLAKLLFGWGRMDPARVAEVGQWAAAGAWTLPALSLVAVAVLVLATVGRLRAAAMAYAAVFGALALLGFIGLRGGQVVMVALCGLFSLLALLLLWSVREQARRALPWREMAVPAALCVLLAPLVGQLPAMRSWVLVLVAGLLAAVVLGISYASSPVLRATLRR